MSQKLILDHIKLESSKKKLPKWFDLSVINLRKQLDEKKKCYLKGQTNKTCKHKIKQLLPQCLHENTKNLTSHYGQKQNQSKP